MLFRSADFVEEYCHDNLKDKSHINKVVNFSGAFGKFNFDMLKALVEEMNRYNEGPEAASSILNTKVEYSAHESYAVTLTRKGVPVEIQDPTVWQGNPISGHINVWFNVYDTRKNNRPVPVPVSDLINSIDKYVDGIDADEDGDVNLKFSPEHIVSIEPKSGKTRYVIGDYELVLTRRHDQQFDIWRSGVF